MRPGMLAIAVIVMCVLAGRIAPAAGTEKHPLVVVRGPTIVALFRPITPAELEKNPDANEALDDFQLYANLVREPLRQAGIEFHELYAPSFRLRDGKTELAFRLVKAGSGYCLIAPGKKPRFEYGVMTDTDLLKLAREYFGPSVKMK